MRRHQVARCAVQGNVCVSPMRRCAQVVIDLPEHLRGCRRAGAPSCAWPRRAAAGARPTQAPPAPRAGAGETPPARGPALPAEPSAGGSGQATPATGSSSASLDAQRASAGEGGKRMSSNSDLLLRSSSPVVAELDGPCCSSSEASRAHADAVAGCDVGAWRLLEGLQALADRPRVFGFPARDRPAPAPPQPPAPLQQLEPSALTLHQAPRASRAQQQVAGTGPLVSGASAAPHASEQPAGLQAATRVSGPDPASVVGVAASGGHPPQTPRRAAPSAAPAAPTRRHGSKGLAAVKGRAAPAAAVTRSSVQDLGLELNACAGQALNPKLAALREVGRCLLGLNADPALVAAYLRARGAAELSADPPIGRALEEASRASAGRRGRLQHARAAPHVHGMAA